MVSLGTRGYKTHRLRVIGDTINTMLMLTLGINQIRQDNCLLAALLITFMVLDLMCLWYNLGCYIKLKNESKPNEREAFLKKIESYGSKRH
jgi:hypothetical protein